MLLDLRSRYRTGKLPTHRLHQCPIDFDDKCLGNGIESNKDPHIVVFAQEDSSHSRRDTGHHDYPCSDLEIGVRFEHAMLDSGLDPGNFIG